MTRTIGRDVYVSVRNPGTVVAVSGGFDPVHIGHVRLFNEVKRLGDHLVVIVNNDNWLRRKKGRIFMPEEERKEFIESFKAVDEVIFTAHGLHAVDFSVCRELEALRPDLFANGGERKAGNIPEYELCERLGIRMAFGVGADKKQRSPRDLVKHARELAALHA